MGQSLHGELVRLRIGTGKGIRGSLLQFAQNAMAHLGGCGIGKGDGHHLARLIDLAQQPQKAPSQQIGLA